MNTNSENQKVGKTFQEMICKSVSEYFQADFDPEAAIPIGHPFRNHKFDCVSDDKKIVIECKCCTWTDTGCKDDGHLLRDVKVFEVDDRGGIAAIKG